MRLTIRPFRDSDAPRMAEWLDRLAPAEDVYSPAFLLHMRHFLPRRRHPRWLVAVVDGEPVGLGREEPQIFGSRPRLRRTWVGVRPDLRRRGIGSQLWQAIEAHACNVGARTFRCWAISDCPEGERFLQARGFSLVQREFQSWVDPRAIEADLLQRMLAQHPGVRVVALGEVLPQMERQLRELFLAGDRDVPHHPQAPAVPANTFRRVILRNPVLDQESSTVVLDGSRPVALCWLKGDARGGRQGIEFTATASSHRGRGLATLAKVAAYHRAARAGVRWIGTANDQDNAPMLAVNRKLGHQRLADLLIYERALDGDVDEAIRAS